MSCFINNFSNIKNTKIPNCYIANANIYIPQINKTFNVCFAFIGLEIKAVKFPDNFPAEFKEMTEEKLNETFAYQIKTDFKIIKIIEIKNTDDIYTKLFKAVVGNIFKTEVNGYVGRNLSKPWTVNGPIDIAPIKSEIMKAAERFQYKDYPKLQQFGKITFRLEDGNYTDKPEMHYGVRYIYFSKMDGTFKVDDAICVTSDEKRSERRDNAKRLHFVENERFLVDFTYDYDGIHFADTPEKFDAFKRKNNALCGMNDIDIYKLVFGISKNLQFAVDDLIQEESLNNISIDITGSDSHTIFFSGTAGHLLPTAFKGNLDLRIPIRMNLNSIGAIKNEVLKESVIQELFNVIKKYLNKIEYIDAERNQFGQIEFEGQYKYPLDKISFYGTITPNGIDCPNQLFKPVINTLKIEEFVVQKEIDKRKHKNKTASENE